MVKPQTWAAEALGPRGTPTGPVGPGGGVSGGSSLLRGSVGRGPGRHSPSPPASRWLRRRLAPNWPRYRAVGLAQDTPVAAGSGGGGGARACPEPPRPERRRPQRPAVHTAMGPASVGGCALSWQRREDAAACRQRVTVLPGPCAVGTAAPTARRHPRPPGEGMDRHDPVPRGSQMEPRNGGPHSSRRLPCPAPPAPPNPPACGLGSGTWRACSPASIVSPNHRQREKGLSMSSRSMPGWAATPLLGAGAAQAGPSLFPGVTIFWGSHVFPAQDAIGRPEQAAHPRRPRGWAGPREEKGCSETPHRTPTNQSPAPGQVWARRTEIGRLGALALPEPPPRPAPPSACLSPGSLPPMRLQSLLRRPRQPCAGSAAQLPRAKPWFTFPPVSSPSLDHTSQAQHCPSKCSVKRPSAGRQ